MIAAVVRCDGCGIELECGVRRSRGLISGLCARARHAGWLVDTEGRCDLCPRCKETR